MRPIKEIFLLLAVGLLVSCSQKYQKGTIFMGSGGGFTGAWQEFQLNADGQLYLRESNKDELRYLRTLDSTQTKKIFKRYYKLKLDRNDLDAPGNIYYYVGHKIGKFRNKKMVFGHQEAPISKEIQKYFDGFMAMALDSTKSK